LVIGDILTSFPFLLEETIGFRVVFCENIQRKSLLVLINTEAWLSPRSYWVEIVGKCCQG